MNNQTVAFIILVIMLFAGIGILMIQPAKLPIITSYPGLFTVFMTLGSAFIIIGLVGLAVIGFVVSNGK